MPDRDALACAQLGDRRAAEYLLYRYRHLVRHAVRRLYLPGAEHEDMLQIGMIGLWQAIVDFREDRCSSFPAFAKVCIKRHLLTAIRTAGRHKQLPLNSSLSLDTPVPSDWSATSPVVGMELCNADPEAVVIRNERTQCLQLTLRRVLSDFEWQVLSHFRCGLSYTEIARHLRCKVKSVDNALARIRRKLSASSDALEGAMPSRTEAQVWH
jgi:RNA polymerase sporulation-specific sigma factor